MFVRQIDLFGANFQFKAFNKARYKTIHGGLLTILAFVLMGTIVYLFGKDFFYKLNPKIFSKEEVPEKPELIIPSNQNFSIMWKIEEDSTYYVRKEREVFFPQITFVKFLKNADNVWERPFQIYVTPKKCSETSNKDNPKIQTFDLDVWRCFDWEEINRKAGETAYLGGQWDSDVVFTFRIDFLTCPYDSDTNQFDMENCSPIEKISDSLSQGAQYFSFNLPTYSFDTTDYENPVKQDYKYIFFRASSRIAFTKYFYLTQEKIYDDKGWILEDIVTNEAVSFNETVSITRFVDDSDFETSANQNYFSVVFYFTKQNKLYYRSYIKIQELFANIGGILKLIAMTFGYFSRGVSRGMLELELATKIKTETKTRISRLRSSTVDNSTMQCNQKEEKQLNATFWQIFKYRFSFWNSKNTKEIDKKLKILEKIDVTELLKRQTADSSQRRENNHNS